MHDKHKQLKSCDTVNVLCDFAFATGDPDLKYYHINTVFYDVDKKLADSGELYINVENEINRCLADHREDDYTFEEIVAEVMDCFKDLRWEEFDGGLINCIQHYYI